MVKIIEAAPTCFGSHKTIIREPHQVRVVHYMHIGTTYLILAKRWMWLPDDGFI